MTPALTPVLALDYLREMSADITGGVLLDAGGEHRSEDEALAPAVRGQVFRDEALAPVARERSFGDEALAPAARDLCAAMGAASHAEGLTRTGAVVAAKSGDLAIVLACRPTAMLGLLQHDLGLVLADLGAPATPVGAPFQVPATLVERLLSAVESQVEG